MMDAWLALVEGDRNRSAVVDDMERARPLDCADMGWLGYLDTCMIAMVVGRQTAAQEFDLVVVRLSSDDQRLVCRRIELCRPCDV